MNDVTRILYDVEQGDPRSAEGLLPLVYDALRELAAAKLIHEKPGQTLQPTALVHEAYLRLVDVEQAHSWQSRGHFFAAAAESMRRILVENARRKAAQKHGGEFVRQDLDSQWSSNKSAPSEEVLAVHECLDYLATEDSMAADLVKLHYFSGFSLNEAGDLLGLSRATAYRTWTYARAWLLAKLQEDARLL